MEFIKVKLSDIGTVVGGSTPFTKNLDNYDGNIAWITPKDLAGYNKVYISKGERNITEVGFKSCSAKMLPKNSVLFSSRAPIGYVAISENDLCTNQGFKSIIPNEKIDYKFLYYLLKYNKDYIASKGSGSTFQEISGSIMKGIELSIPKDINDQKKISKVLFDIDKKIELNNEINNNLYELMKNKFDNFIDNLDRYEESVLSKIANYKNGLAMQKYRPINELGLPVIKIREMNSGISTETERCKSDIDDEVIINNGDVLFAWSGTLCMSIWCGGKAGLNQHIFKVTSDKYPKWFYYFWTLKHLNKFIEIAAGKATTMGHIKRTELDKSTVKIPSDKSLEEADKIFTPLLNKYISNNIENRNLIQLRDTLLPKLMNGEINLDNIEI